MTARPLPPPFSSRPGAPALAALALFLATAALYLPTVEYRYVGIDDNVMVQDNPLITGGLTPAGIATAFTRTEGGLWVPLTTLSFMTDVTLLGEGPRGHHLVNLLLFALDTALLFLLLHRLTGALWPSALAAALFAFHPLRVESVAWVIERKDVLSLFFLLLALGCHARYAQAAELGAGNGERRIRLAAVALLFLLGLMAKPVLVTLPLLLLALDHWPLARHETPWRERLREKLPLFLIAAAFTLSTLATLPAWQEPMPLLLRLQHGLFAPFIYLGTTLWPSELGYRHYLPFRDALQPALLALTAAGVAALSTAAWRLRRRQPWLAFGWAWYLTALLPVAGFLSTGGQWIADRFTLIPHIGLMAAFVWGGAGLLRPERSLARRIAAVALSLLLLAAGALLTRHYLPVWRDMRSFAERGLALTPGIPVFHNNLGAELLLAGDAVAAAAHFSSAIAIDPAYAETHFNLALALVQLGRPEEALSHLADAVRLAPADTTFRQAFADLLAETGRFAQAEEQRRVLGGWKP